MRKINICHYSFISFQDNNFAILSYLSKELIYQKEIIKNLFPSCQCSENKKIDFLCYNNLEKVYPIKKNAFFKIENVSNTEQLKTVLEIRNGTFVAKNEFEIFLQENGLLVSWISGDLEGTISSFYSESSRDFGKRNKYSENNNKFNNHHEIWKLCKYFDGLENEKDGNGYYYKLSYRLIKLAGVDCNTGWLEQKKKIYCI